MLPVVKMETLSGALDVYKMFPDSIRLYTEMFEQQPVFKHLVSCLGETGWSNEMIDGYCRGLFQAWHLLNAQAFVEDMNDQN
jgi:hypothetical protein